MVAQMSKTRFLLSRAGGSSFVAYYARMVDQMSKNCFLLSRACGVENLIIVIDSNFDTWGEIYFLKL
jgi:hypothetical protein